MNMGNEHPELHIVKKKQKEEPSGLNGIKFKGSPRLTLKSERAGITSEKRKEA